MVWSPNAWTGSNNEETRGRFTVRGTVTALLNNNSNRLMRKTHKLGVTTILEWILLPLLHKTPTQLDPWSGSLGEEEWNISAGLNYLQRKRKQFSSFSIFLEQKRKKKRWRLWRILGRQLFITKMTRSLKNWVCNWHQAVMSCRHRLSSRSGITSVAPNYLTIKWKGIVTVRVRDA